MKDKTEEFIRKLNELLKEYNMAITADNMGDINLERGMICVGYWGGHIANEYFHDWEN